MLLNIGEIYLIFALATSITCCIQFFWPELKKAKQKGVNNPFTNNPYISALAYTIIATAVAPILFIILLSSSASSSYTLGIHKVINKEKN